MFKLTGFKYKGENIGFLPPGQTDSQNILMDVQITEKQHSTSCHHDSQRKMSEIWKYELNMDEIVENQSVTSWSLCETKGFSYANFENFIVVES